LIDFGHDFFRQILVVTLNNEVTLVQPEHVLLDCLELIVHLGQYAVVEDRWWVRQCKLDCRCWEAWVLPRHYV